MTRLFAFPIEIEQTGTAEIVHFNASGQSALDRTRQILAKRCLCTETTRRDDHALDPFVASPDGIRRILMHAIV